jgi:hypothetical protein
MLAIRVFPARIFEEGIRSTISRRKFEETGFDNEKSRLKDPFNA